MCQLWSLGAPRINEAIRAAKKGVRKTVFADDQMICSLRNGQETLHAFGKTANKWVALGTSLSKVLPLHNI